MVNTGAQFKKVASELFDGNQSELARALGMKPGSFSKYTSEADPTTPGSNILIRLMSLGINLNWFLGGVPPMFISDITEAQVSKVSVVNDDGDDDYFSEIDRENLNQSEAALLDEVTHFSNFLKKRPLNPHVKTMLLELLIQSIDQAKEQPPRD